MIKFVGIITASILLLTACTGGSGGSDLAFLDSNLPGKASTIRIENFTPTADPIVLASTESRTFAITAVSDVSTGLEYEFLLDNQSLFKGTQAFYEIRAQDLSAGLHTLQAIAKVDDLTASHDFRIRRNSKPSLGSTSPAQTGSSLLCGTQNLTLTAQANDADSDSLSFSWKLNGATSSALTVLSTSANASSVRFSPTCVQTGPLTITVDVSDGYETTSYNWSVGVGDPSVATIIAYTPQQSSITLASTGSQSFSISATGKNPLSYEWRLDGSVIAGAISAIYNLDVSPSGVAVGSHTLEVKVSDADSDDTQSWIVIKNAPPEVLSFSPLQASFKTNYKNSIAFSVNVTDANGDTPSFEWRLNGVLNHPSLSISSTTGTSTAQLLSNATLVGTNTLELKVSDGLESVYTTWSPTLNYFTNECNSTTATGRICTLAGSKGIGDGLSPLNVNDASRIYIQPSATLDDGNGNLFISDNQNHVIWFYNRSASTVRIATKDIAPGTIIALLGNGANGMTADGSTYNNFKLSNPQGMIWIPGSSPSDQRLFIADYGNNRVVMMDATGAGQRVLGRTDTTNSAATNGDGVLGISHLCSGPIGLAYDNLINKIYVACRDMHAIKALDISDPSPLNWTANTIIGRNNGSGAVAAGSADGALGFTTTAAQARYPRGLALDSRAANRSLYFTEDRDTCRIRVINRSGSSATYFGSVAAANNQVTTIAGTYNNCPAPSATPVNVVGNRFYNPLNLVLREDGSGNLQGIFVIEQNHHRILFLNNTVAQITLGGVDVPSYQMATVMGTGTGDYNGNGQLGFETMVNLPTALTWNSTKTALLVSDRTNNRVRALDTTITAGKVQTLVGQASRGAFLSDIPIGAADVYMSAPTQAIVDSSGADDLLYYSDSGNGRVRSINLTTGLVATALGRGVNNAAIENETPADVYTRSLRSLFLAAGNLIYVDRTTNNCQVRLWNRSGSDIASIFGISVEKDRIATIAGKYSLGCGAWAPAYESVLGNTVRLNNPSGFTQDSTGAYISNTSSHCILKMTSSGIISTHIGLCNTGANVNGSLAGNSIRLNNPTQIVADPRHPGNLFIVDQSASATSAVKYANFSSSAVFISDIEIAAGQILPVASSAGYYSGFALADNQLCFASGNPGNGDQGSHNVVCKNRDDNTGNISIRIGPPDASLLRGGAAMNSEQENVHGTSARLFSPMGLAFDRIGNLYIIENSSHVIRRVNRWW